MAEAPSFERIDALLGAEQERVARLLGVLQAESEGLAQRDLSAIERAAAEKQQLVIELDQLDRVRRDMLAAAGIAPSRSGFAELVERHDRDGRLAARWAVAREQLEACRQQNIANGRVIEPARRATQQALGILLGRDQSQSTELYDQQGSRHSDAVHGRASFKA